MLYSDRLRFRSFDLLRSEKYNVTFFCVRQWPRLFLCREAITQTDKARRLSHQSPPNSNNNTMIRSDKTNYRGAFAAVRRHLSEGVIVLSRTILLCCGRARTTVTKTTLDREVASHSQLPIELTERLSSFYAQ